MHPLEKHLMIDIESMSTDPNAVIQSVAMLSFDPLNTDVCTIGMEWFPPVEAQIAEGRHRNPSTLLWWSEQRLEAQIKLLEGRKKARDSGVTLEAVREGIKRAVEDADHIWANGPDFDCTILRNFMGPDFNWPFWKHRCVRTLRSMFSEHMPDRPESLIAHDALDDCYAQVDMVQAAFRAAGIKADIT